MSAPPVRNNRRRPSHPNNGNDSAVVTGPVLVPSLGSVYTADITPAELQAWATLAKDYFDDFVPINKVRPRRKPATGLRDDASCSAMISSDEIGAASRDTSGGTPSRPRPSSAKMPRKMDPLFEHLRNTGPAATSSATSGQRRQKEGDNSCISLPRCVREFSILRMI